MKYHLTRDGRLLPCHAQGSCPIAPKLFHFEEEEIPYKMAEIDRYNELKSKGTYSKISFQQGGSDDDFFLHPEQIPQFHSVDLLLISETLNQNVLDCNKEIQELERTRQQLEKEEAKIYEQYRKIEQSLAEEKEEQDFSSPISVRSCFTVVYESGEEKDFTDSELIYDWLDGVDEYKIPGEEKPIFQVYFSDAKTSDTISKHRIEQKKKHIFFFPKDTKKSEKIELEQKAQQIQKEKNSCIQTIQTLFQRREQNLFFIEKINSEIHRREQ